MPDEGVGKSKIYPDEEQLVPMQSDNREVKTANRNRPDTRVGINRKP